MEQTIDKVESAGRQMISERVPAAEVRKALSAILQSPPFHSSKQSQALLQYIVDQTLADHPEMLKERAIGANIFGRRIDYATNDDPIVRARAAEVRKRLALYYLTTPDDPVRISIPSGSFRATFEWGNKTPVHLPPAAPEGSQLAAPPAVAEALPRSLPARFRGRRLWMAIAVAAVLATSATYYYASSSKERAFNQFWSPVFDNSSPVLISIGSNPAYALSASYIKAYYRQHSGSQNEGMEPYVPFPPGTKLDASDLVLANDTLVALSDVAATSKILSLMVRRKKQFDIRLGDDMTYGDLREDPAILIGAYNNPWTLSTVKKLRYVFSARADILDRSDPQKRWSANADSSEDYAIVSRVVNTDTGKTILIAAGITGAGTRAAAEFISDPQAIAALAKSLPKGWERKNIEVVLHASVANGVPTTPQVIAEYCW